jgi:hypothetical protein
MGHLKHGSPGQVDSAGAGLPEVPFALAPKAVLGLPHMSQNHAAECFKCKSEEWGVQKTCGKAMRPSQRSRSSCRSAEGTGKYASSWEARSWEYSDRARICPSHSGSARVDFLEYGREELARAVKVRHASARTSVLVPNLSETGKERT